MRRLRLLLVGVCLAVTGHAHAQARQAWVAPQQPVRIFGNTYYVGSQGLSAILVTSDQGHVLLDAPMGQNAGMIAANIRALGFRLEDVRLILNSHVHFDHAGATADLQRLSGAAVAARPASAPVLESGRSGPDDPQFGLAGAMKPVAVTVRIVADGEVVRVGPLALTAHATGGHTPGGTSWSWRSCETGRDGERCLNLVYADSLNAISADGFRYSNSRTYPTGVQDFEHGFATLSSIPCDILLTPHPEASQFWDRIGRRDRGGDATALVDPTACRRYAESGRTRLQRRLDTERNTQ
jgi:metallo-beta-lactamase class B